MGETMSRRDPGSQTVVEWSPSHVQTFTPGVGRSQGFPSPGIALRAALSRRNTFVRAIRVPNVGAAEVEKILRLQLPQSFPVPANDLVFTYRLTSDVGPEGRLATVAAARAEVVRSLHASLRESGVRAEEVVPAAFGSMLLAQSMGLKQTAVVERTPEGWAIDLVADGELRYSRVVPLETDSAGLEAEVLRTWSMAGLEPGGTLAAAGADLDFATVRSGSSTLELLSGAQAGALKVGLELPEVLLSRERKLVGNRARLAVLLWVAAVALGLVVGLDRLEAGAEIRKAQGALSTETKKLRSKRDAAKTKLAGLDKSLDALERAFTPVQRASDILALVGALAPKELWLTGITFERGKPITIRGTAMDSTSVAAYLDALSSYQDPATAQTRFRDVKLVFATDSAIEDTKVSQFSISLHAIGNLPLSDPKSRSARTASR
jgi:Tfp pilus assembly protein PilN